MHQLRQEGNSLVETLAPAITWAQQWRLCVILKTPTIYSSKMLLFQEKLVGLPIASVQSSHRIGEVTGYLIDPRNLSIVALYASTRLNSGNLILHTEDIKSLTPAGIVIDHNEQLMETEGLVRLQEVINFNFKLIGKPVFTEEGIKLGKVENFAFDSINFKIMKLYVKPSLGRWVTKSNLIINRSQIVKVSDRKVTVKSAAAQERKRAFLLKKLVMDTKPVVAPDTIEKGS